MRNAPLLERTLQHILDDPEHHIQSSWITETNRAGRCGTAGCFAGWAMLLDGLTYHEVVQLVITLVPPSTQNRSGIPVNSLYARATDRLGLTYGEARILFHYLNTREMLTLMVKDLVNGDELQPLDFYFEQATDQ